MKLTSTILGQQAGRLFRGDFWAKLQQRFFLLCVASPAFLNFTAFAQGAETSAAPVLQPGNTATAASSAGAAPAWMNLVLIGGMVLFMYLFVIRPNAKRQKEHKAFIESLVPGKEVITSSGLIGKITSVADTVVTIDLGSTTVRVLKTAVSGELGKSNANVTAGSLPSAT